MSLRRVLSLWEAVFWGVGIIIGAGIYALVGVAGVQAGGSLWLAFLAAGILAALTALSYAELSSVYPEAGTSFQYVRHAFENRAVSFVAGWLVAAAGIVAATTVALAFGQYAYGLWGVPPIGAAAAVLLAVGVLNAASLKVASRFNTAATLLEVTGLLLIIGLAFTSKPERFLTFALDMPQGAGGFLNAIVLSFFAYLGFEVVANTAEEIKDPKKNLPLAILFSLGICAVLYILVAQSFVSLLSYDEAVAVVQQGKGPLSVAAGAVGGLLFLTALGVIALFSTANTVLVSLFGSSRMEYGMAKRSALPAAFSRTNADGLPVFAVMASTALSLALLFVGDLSLLGEATVMGMLAVFLLDNAALIRLRQTLPHIPRAFRVPGEFKGVPLPAAIAAITCAALILYQAVTNPSILWVVGLLGGLGYGLYRMTGRY